MIKNPRAKKILQSAVLVLILFAVFRGIFVLVLLIALSLSMSFIVNNLQLRQFGLELVTFVAVLTGVNYGPWISLVITFILITYHLVAGGFMGNYVLWVIPAYSMGAIVSGFLSMDVAALGTIITFGINTNNVFFTALNSPSFLPKYMIYAVTNIIFNVFLFSLLAGPISLLL